MSVTVEQAHAIMQAVTVDVWNQRFKTERIKLLETYCSPQMKAYAPDGSETTGFEDCDSNYDKLHADGRADWVFEGTGELWMNANMIMQKWSFGKDGEGWKGWDVIILDPDGKVEALYGLLEGVHTHSL